MNAYRRFARVHSLEQSYDMISLSKRIVEHSLRQCLQTSSVCILVSHTRCRKESSARAVKDIAAVLIRLLTFNHRHSTQEASCANIYDVF